LREACVSIEEISAEQRAAAMHRDVDCMAPLICWKGALENLNRFLAAFNHASV